MLRPQVASGSPRLRTCYQSSTTLSRLSFKFLIILLPLSLVVSASGVESVHFGFNSTNAAMTDAIRLSTRTGTNWWSQNTQRLNPEDNNPIPYSYHDGYVENIGNSVNPMTPAFAADRWYKLMHGQGDTWTGVSAATAGFPKIILLDEIATGFTVAGQGPALQEALRLYLTNSGASRNDIIGYAGRSVSLTANIGNYTNVVYCAKNYLRFLALEVYVTQEGFTTGYERDQPGVYRGTNDAYLVNRFVAPIRQWLTAGVAPTRLMPIVAVANFGDANGTTTKPFYKFLNRQFWFLANGWYTSDHSLIDTNLQAVLRNGVGNYTWTPGTNTWNLMTNQTDLDTHYENYLKWYCVDGHLDPHPDGVDAGPNQAPSLTTITNRIVNANSILSFTNSATDLDFPANNLSFSLDPGAPSGAMVGSSSGVFTWATPQNQAPVTNSITVRVTDDGSPSMSSARTFAVITVPPPRLTSFTPSGSNLIMTWQTYPAKKYRLQSKTNLTDAAWVDFTGDLVAAGTSLSVTNSFAGSAQRFYRVLQVN